MGQRYFQWIAGERRGHVVFYDKTEHEGDMVFIKFKDDSRVNIDLVADINDHNLDGKLVAEIDSPQNQWEFKEVADPDSKPRIEQDWESQTKYEVPSVEELQHAELTGETGVVKPIPKKKKIDLIPPRKTRTKTGRVATQDQYLTEVNADTTVVESKDPITTQQKVEETTPEKLSVNSDDPVYIMMNKSKKVDTEVDMTLTIQLPSKALFDVAVDSFDEGGDKALGYIIENIDITDIKNALKAGIAQMYGLAVWEGQGKIDNAATEQLKQSLENVIESRTETIVDPTVLGEPAPVEGEEPEVRVPTEAELESVIDNREEIKKLQEKADKINQKNG